MGRRKNTLCPEARIYEWLGIRLLKKIILRLEKWKHRKDGGQNENYHPRGTSCRDFRHFTVYLKYNAILHTISLAFTGLYFLVCGNKIPVLSALLAVMTAGNIWCILLQRYHYLCFRSLREKLRVRKTRKMEKQLPALLPALKALTPDDRHRCGALLLRLRKAALGEEVCILGREDLAALEMIRTLLPAVPGEKPIPPAPAEPYGSLEGRILRYARNLRIPDPFPRGGVIPSDREVFDSYRAVFSQGREETVLFLAGLWDMGMAALGEDL